MTPANRRQPLAVLPAAQPRPPVPINIKPGTGPG